MKILAASLALLLTACSAALPLAQGDVRAPFISQYQVTAEDGTDSLVVGEYQGDDRWRWLQTSPLGAPLARQIYESGQWRNDGFLPPNRSATALFTALMLRENPLPFRRYNVRVTTTASAASAGCMNKPVTRYMNSPLPPDAGR